MTAPPTSKRCYKQIHQQQTSRTPFSLTNWAVGEPISSGNNSVNGLEQANHASCLLVSAISPCALVALKLVDVNGFRHPNRYCVLVLRREGSILKGN